MKNAATAVAKFAVGLLAIILLTMPGNAAIKYASVNGNWNAGATWGGTVPSSGDDIVINPGIAVTINDNFTGATLEVSAGASLVFDNTGTSHTLIFSGNVIVDATGSFTSQNSGS